MQKKIMVKTIQVIVIILMLVFGKAIETGAVDYTVGCCEFPPNYTKNTVIITQAQCFLQSGAWGKGFAICDSLPTRCYNPSGPFGGCCEYSKGCISSGDGVGGACETCLSGTFYPNAECDLVTEKCGSTTSSSTTTSSTTTTVSTTTSTDGGDVITLSSFEAIPENKKVTLRWATKTEIDNAGFNLYRSESEDGEYSKINDTLISAEGSSTQGASYEFIDSNVQNRKTYYYKLEDIDLNGTSTMHGPESATPRLIHGILGK